MNRSIRFALFLGFGVLPATLVRAGNVLTGKSVPVQIEVPADWVSDENTDPSPFVQIDVENKKEKCGVTVADVPVQPGTPVPLEEYASKRVEMVAKSLENAAHTDLKPVTVGGQKALRCELTGLTKHDGVQTTIVTCTETADDYADVYVSAPKVDFESKRTALTAVADSFKPAPPPTKPVELWAKNGIAEWSLPAGWREDPGAPPTEQGFQGFNRALGAHVSVEIPQPRGGTDLKFQDFADSVADAMLRMGTDASNTDWVPLKIDGHDAMQCELHLTYQNLKQAYVVTVIQGDDMYWQLHGWTAEADFARNGADLKKVTAGFKITAGRGGIVEGSSLPITVEIPAGWIATPISDSNNDTLQVFAENKKAKMALLVAHESIGPANDVALDAYKDKALDHTFHAQTDPSHTAWESLKVNGRAAVRCEFSGSSKEGRKTTVFTLIKTDEGYDKLLAYCSAADFAANRQTLVTISDSFKHGSPLPAKAVTLKGKRGFVQLELPAGWAQAHDPKDAGAELHAENKKLNCGASITADDKRATGVALKEYATTITGRFESIGGKGTHTAMESLKVDGHDALRCEVHLTIGGKKAVYLLTFIETDDHYYQLNCWAAEEFFAAALPEMKKIPDGFKELPAPNGG